MSLQKSVRGGTAAAGLLCLWGSNAAWCVDATVADDSGGVLNEIVVTATKRAENVQVVPITVAVVSQSELQSQNLTNTGDLKRLVPGLEYRHTATPGADAFNIRGVETLAAGAYGLEQSAGISFDGVPLARPVGSIADLVDVHSVEVLMGPQGMLFGKNASAGLINIVTNIPELGKTDATVRAAYGTLNDQQYSGTLNLAAGEEGAMRLTAWKFKHDGTIHEVNTGQDMGNKDSGGVRFKYRLKPTEQLDLNFTGEWVSHDQNPAGYSIRAFDPAFFTRQNSGALVEAYELGQGTKPSDTNSIARGLNEPYFDRGHTNAYSGQADYEVGEGTVTALAAYRQIQNANSFDAFPSTNPYSQQPVNTDFIGYHQWSEELRYASPVSRRLRYVVGLFNFDLKLDDALGFAISSAIPGVGLVPVLNAHFAESLRNSNYAGFGQATFDITPQLQLIGGIRKSWETLTASMQRSGPAIAALGGPFQTSNSSFYNDLSWRTGLQFQFTPDVMIYATASRGYKGPGNGYSLGTTPQQLAANNNDIVKPEIVHAYEIGLKSQWFERRMTVNLSIFDEHFDDFQTSLLVPAPNNVNTNILVTANAGQMVSQGAELSARWLITNAFSLALSEAYTNARFTDFKNDGCYATQTVAQGCVGNKQNADGRGLADSPRERLTVTARYERPLSARISGFLQANGSYRSHVSYSNTFDPPLQQGGYTLLNLSAGVATSDGHWNVQVYGNNVLDKHYVDMVVNGGSGDSVIFNDLGYQDLATVGIALTAHF